MPEEASQHGMPDLIRVRLVETEVKVGEPGPTGPATVGLELEFALFNTGERLKISSHYTVTRDGEGEKRDLYISNLAHEFWFDSKFTSADSLQQALRSVWPYVRRDMENIAKAHDLPLRGVPLMLADDAFTDEVFADFEPDNAVEGLDS